MGDLLRSFLRERVSEDKTRWKDLCWFVGTVVDLGCHNYNIINTYNNNINNNNNNFN